MLPTTAPLLPENTTSCLGWRASAPGAGDTLHGSGFQSVEKLAAEVAFYTSLSAQQLISQKTYLRICNGSNVRVVGVISEVLLHRARMAALAEQSMLAGWPEKAGIELPAN